MTSKNWLDVNGHFGIGIIRCDVTHNPFLTVALVSPKRSFGSVRWMLWVETVPYNVANMQSGYLMVLPVSSQRLRHVGVAECGGVLVDAARVERAEQQVEGGARAVAVSFPHLLMLMHTFGVHVVQRAEEVLPTNWSAAWSN